MSTQPDTLIAITTGKVDRGTRATLAFAWGCAALAMGQQVTVYLTTDGAIWALRGASFDVAVGGYEPLSEYIEQFTALGGELLVCAPCTQYYCGFDEKQQGAALLDAVELCGLATIVSKTGPNTNVITF